MNSWTAANIMICPISDVITDFETRLDGGGFGDNLAYGPAHPTIISHVFRKGHTEHRNRKDKE
jgi:hypothetical protein